MPDHAFKYHYELLNPDGSFHSYLEIIVFFWKNSETNMPNSPVRLPDAGSRPSKEQELKPLSGGILILYIRDEHHHDYELSDFPDTVKQAILSEIKRFLDESIPPVAP